MWREEGEDQYYLTDNRSLITFTFNDTLLGIFQSTDAQTIRPNQIDQEWLEEVGWNVVTAEVVSVTETGVTLSYRDIEIILADNTLTPSVDEYVH